MAEEENNVEEPKKSGKGLMIALIALVVILLLTVIGGGYFLYSKGVFSDNPSAQEQVVKEPDPSEMFKSELKDLVLNITNSKGREKLMKLSFAIKANEPTIEAIVEEYKAEIVDTVIALISARSSEELLTVGGKALLKEELKDEINTLINKLAEEDEDIQKDAVKNILFTTFVIK